jgi:Sulfotransferase family
VTPPPFFIVGCDRSGTTMLRLILDGSPDVAIPTESMILVDFAGRAGDALASDEEFDRLAGAVWRHPKVREWGLPGGPPLRQGRTGPDAYRAALEAPFLA